MSRGSRASSCAPGRGMLTRPRTASSRSASSRRRTAPREHSRTICSQRRAHDRSRYRRGIATSLSIPSTEFESRRSRLLEHVRQNGLSGYVLFGADYIQYFTGFWFLSNERPVVYAESTSGESAIFVPEFEVERTRAEADFVRIESYPEYPGLEHPMSIFARVVAELGIARAIGADNDGYPGILGYKGPPLSEVTGASVAPLAD